MTRPSHTVDATTPKDNPIRLEQVTLRFGDVTALDAVTLGVRRGDIAVVIGSSGAGKTSLARVLLGLSQPTAGAVYIDGEDIHANRRSLVQARSKLGMVFQYSALLDSIDVMANVALPLEEQRREGQRAIERKVRDLLHLLGLDGVEHRYPSELSGGMRKRVALARALIRRPSILVYDEPASGLDPSSARHVDELIASTRDRFGVTSLVISHDMAQTARLADRLYVLEAGRLVAEGSVAELTARHGSLAAQFFEASRS